MIGLLLTNKGANKAVKPVALIVRCLLTVVSVVTRQLLIYADSKLSCPHQWRNQGGGSWGSCPPPLAENLSCTAYCYCTILRFTGHAIIVIEIEPLTLTVLLKLYSIEAKARSIRSIVGKWNIWVMRCGSCTSGNTQTPNCWLQGLHILSILYKSNILLQQAGYGRNSLLIVTVHWSLHEKRKSLSSPTFRQKYTKIRIAGRKGTRQELSYRKQIARQLCTQYVEGTHRPWPWNVG